MKVFVSWSGKLSRAIAQTLKQWLPCMIQSLEIFFSPEDIEKGSNWDVQISSELSQCKYGIICLTNDNISAPWINFEAGALAKELDSHISALMVNIKPSDIKGPLARYQSTKLEKTDFFQLINNINALQEKPLDASVLQNIFDSLWGKMEAEFNRAVQQSGLTQNNRAEIDSPIEELLQLVRKQNNILSNPEMLLPPDYFRYMQERFFSMPRSQRRQNSIASILLATIDNLISCIENSGTKYVSGMFDALHFDFFFEITNSCIREMEPERIASQYLKRLSDCHQRYQRLLSES